MHTPVDVTATGRDRLRRGQGGLPRRRRRRLGHRAGQGAGGAHRVAAGRVPTTYAGSEVTPVARRDRRRYQDHPVVAGDPARDRHLRRRATLGLPVPLAVTSGVNAMAHAVEALYSPDAEPGRRRARARGDRPAGPRRCPASSAGPTTSGPACDAPHRRLAGRDLPGRRRMGAAPQAVPHARRLVRAAARADPHGHAAARHGVQRGGRARSDAAHRRGARRRRRPGAVYDSIREAGGPTSLRESGMAETDIDRAADWRTASPYPNRDRDTGDGVRALLRGGVARATAPRAPPWRPRALTEQVVASFAGTADPRAAHPAHRSRPAACTVRRRQRPHPGRVEHAIDFLTRTGQHLRRHPAGVRAALGHARACPAWWTC